VNLKKPSYEKLRIMVVNDDEDILRLYNDYLSGRGHQVLKTYLAAENVMDDVERENPNIYLIDPRMHAAKEGLDLAAEILEKYPAAAIVFVTTNDDLGSELSKHPIFEGKRLKVLMKPARLDDIEMNMLDLVREEPSYPNL
jgi:DNA-binding NtrC family response regulator